eukprot:12931404-Prorocentrum_lima.AAC.1
MAAYSRNFSPAEAVWSAFERQLFAMKEALTEHKPLGKRVQRHHTRGPQEQPLHSQPSWKQASKPKASQ